MVITAFGKEQATIRLGSDVPFPKYVNIGSGSGTATTTNIILVAETDRNNFTTTDFTTANKFKFTADFNSVEMSGTNLREFGAVPSGPAAAGSTWQREAFPSISFDGTNELKIDVTWEVF